MKKLWFNIIFFIFIYLIFPNKAFSAIALEHSNNFDMNAFYGVNINNVDYLYGYTWSGTTYSIVKGNISTGVVTNVYSFSSNVVIKCLWKAPDNSYQIVVVGDTNSSPTVFYLYRSTDNFNTITRVQQVNGNLGQRNLCILEKDMPGVVGSKGWLFYADYGVGASGDVIGTRLYKSSDNGETWETIVTYNSSGSKTHIAHFHGVWQDPYTGYLYICSGDTDTETMLIRWDGSGTWTNDELPATFASNVVSRPQFKIFVGSQIGRTVDIIFGTNNILTFSDSYVSSDVSGIWSWVKDLSSKTKVNNDIMSRGINGDDGFSIYHVGWLGLKLSSGNYLFTTMQDNAGQEPRINVFTSSDGLNWQAVARFNLRDGSKAYMYSLFEYKGKIYASTVQSLIASWTTVEFIENGNFDPYTLPENLTILHPVRYVGNWGLGTPSAVYGYSKFLPASSLETVLEASASGSNSFRKGTRIRLSAGTHSVGDTYITWSTLASTSQSRGCYLIDGCGPTTTFIQIALSGNITIQTGNTSVSPLIFKNLSISTLATSGKDLILSATSYTKIINCILEPPSGSYVIFGNSGCNLEIINSVLKGLTSGVIQCIYINGTSGVTGYVKALNSVFYKGYRGIDFRGYGDSQLTVINCVFAGQLNDSLDWQNTTAIPVIKNSIFYNSTSGVYSLYDRASLTETSDYINNNDYYGLGTTKINIATDADSFSLNCDPNFINYPSDFNLSANSLCINAGTVVSGIHDKTSPNLSASNVYALTTPDIGAYEFPIQKLYFNANSSETIQNGTKNYPYHTFTVYPSYIVNGAFTGYNLRKGVILNLEGVLDELDLSGLSETSVFTLNFSFKGCFLTKFVSNGDTVLNLGGLSGTSENSLVKDLIDN